MAGPNIYTYVRNDPLNAIDPLGLATLSLSGGYSWINGNGSVGSGGIYFTTHGSYGLPDIGFFRSIGKGTGIDIGVSVQAGYTPGNVSESDS